jgi:hypothetical protein
MAGKAFIDAGGVSANSIVRWKAPALAGQSEMVLNLTETHGVSR